MKQRFTWLLAFSLLALAGCEARSEFGDQSVVGPDLGHSGPFDAAHDVTMVNPDDDDSAPSGRRSVTIHRATPEDTGQVVNLFSNTSKPFLAGISYLGFTPIVAETNAQARTYWLVGFNLTRTPDRSVYMILRYPKNLDITPGLRSDAFEYLSLDCSDLSVARHPADYYAPLPDGKTREEPAPDPAPEAGDCEFNSLREATTLAALTLRRYDQIKHENDAPQPTWHPLHVEVN